VNEQLSTKTSSSSFFSETKDENSFVVVACCVRARLSINNEMENRDRQSLEALRFMIAKTLKKFNAKLSVFQKWQKQQIVM